MAIKPIKKLRLQGFNNLTKTLSFNIYDICYARTPAHRTDYIKYIDDVYDAEKLTQILLNVARIIGAHVLNIAREDYDPQGASVTMLIAEDEIAGKTMTFDDSEEPGPLPGFIPLSQVIREGVELPQKRSLVGHLDKSHITVHTYPESHPDNGISTFRADIDVATCGRISPLKALNYLLHSFESDIVTIDYRVRGFTRDTTGKKFFIDHKINSIQSFIDKADRHKYQMIDVNVFQENIFHTKMLRREFQVENYVFGTDAGSLDAEELGTVRKRLLREMLEIYYGRRIKKGQVFE
ncbi:MAG: adenosylmethionine decarboxylase [Deltaproteobacteria bacterium]|nr:adenosylmethionine decarboxylase [Deltaproteobacteria bacterium]